MLPLAFLLALIAVESNGNDFAVGDRGRALGCLQIHQRVIEDVNRIYGTRYNHSHGLDRTHSLRICELYLTYWGSKLPYQPSLEDYARIWNGGPLGWRKQGTLAYWSKVRTELSAPTP